MAISCARLCIGVFVRAARQNDHHADEFVVVDVDVHDAVFTVGHARNRVVLEGDALARLADGEFNLLLDGQATVSQRRSLQNCLHLPLRADRQHMLEQLVGEAQELLVAGNEVGLAAQVNQCACASVFAECACNHTLIDLLAGAFAGDNRALLTQD
jgi:hypothetical protein